jgi:hypothetical protein
MGRRSSQSGRYEGLPDLNPYTNDTDGDERIYAQTETWTELNMAALAEWISSIDSSPSADRLGFWLAAEVTDGGRETAAEPYRSESHQTPVSTSAPSTSVSVSFAGSSLSALHLAAYCGDAEGIVTLAGVPAEVTGERSWPTHPIVGTPLHMAIFGQQQHCVEVLVALKSDINVSSGIFGTPLHAACCCGSEILRDVFKKNLNWLNQQRSYLR